MSSRAELDDTFLLVDEVWCGSRFVRDAVAARTEKPVHALPLSYEIPAEPTMSRAEVGFDERLTFLFVMDFDSVLERKNPLGLIDAYTRAFPEPGPTRLVIKTINGDKHPTELERVRWAARDRTDIDLWDRYLTAEHKGAMIAHCDGYVSLHRSEGIGLTIAEAMARARPVIATHYSGNVDFMDPAVTFAVPWTPAPVPPGAGPYRTGAEWADPDIEVAADHLRWIASNRDEARARGEAAREHLRRNHSPERAAAFVRERLAYWRERRDAGWVPDSYGTPVEPAPPCQPVVRRWGALSGGTHIGQSGRTVRRSASSGGSCARRWRVRSSSTRTSCGRSTSWPPRITTPAASTIHRRGDAPGRA